MDSILTSRHKIRLKEFLYNIETLLLTTKNRLKKFLFMINYEYVPYFSSIWAKKVPITFI